MRSVLLPSARLPRSLSARCPLISSNSAVARLILCRLCRRVKYCVVFVDGCTRYKFVYPIAKKSGTLFAMKKFVQQVGKPQSVLTDWGSEFDGQFDEYCTENAIRTLHSCPYRAWQNGLVERGNKELKLMTKCLLVQSGLPPQLWGQAVLIACYIHNRTAGRHCPTPYQLMTPVSFGRRPDVGHLRTFSCPCYPLVEKHFGVEAHHNCACEPGIFVGYCPCSTGYLVYLPHKNRVMTRMDVRFDEGTLTALPVLDGSYAVLPGKLPPPPV